MSSKTGFRAYFKFIAVESEGPVVKKQIANPKLIISATENIKRTQIAMVIDEVEKSITMVIDEVEKSVAWKNHYNSIPKHT